jgi:hypothetical protein
MNAGDTDNAPGGRSRGAYFCFPLCDFCFIAAVVG